MLHTHPTLNIICAPSRLIDDGWKMKGDAVDILMFKKGINGHPGKDTTHDIIKGLNLNVKLGTMETCWVCTVAKAKQKNVVQFSLHKMSQVPGEIFFLDLSSVRPPEGVVAFPRANWRIVVNECTNFKVSHIARGKTRWQRQHVS